MHFSKQPALFAVILITLSNLQLSIQSQQQYIDFFKALNCTNATGRRNATDFTLETQPGYSDANSVVENGLWGVSIRTSSNSYTTTTGRYIDECIPKISGYRSYMYIERYGPIDQAKSEISFYAETSFSGVRFISDGNNLLTLPRPIAALSWHFSGVDGWIVYPNTNFTGVNTCLSSRDEVKQKKYGFTWSFDSQLVVGSAKKGCGNGDGGNSTAAYNFSTNYFTISLFLVVCVQLAS